MISSQTGEALQDLLLDVCHIWSWKFDYDFHLIRTNSISPNLFTRVMLEEKHMKALSESRPGDKPLILSDTMGLMFSAVFGERNIWFLGPVYTVEVNEKDIEKLLVPLRTGNMDYSTALSRAAVVSPGIRVRTGDPLRQARYSVIAFITLCSRAAMDGGLPADTAYTLSDTYSTALDTCTTISEITVVSHTMYKDFITRVHRCRTASGMSRGVRIACDYMEMHPDEEINLTLLAEKTGYAPYYLSRIFKQETGLTPAAWLQKVRLEQAKILLSSTRMSIQEISERFRFCTRSYFTDVFRREYGVEEASAWVLRAGEYVLYLADCPCAALTLEEEKCLEKCTAICPPAHEIGEIRPPERTPVDTARLPRYAMDNAVPETIYHSYETPQPADELTDRMSAEQLICLTVGGGTSNKNLQVEAMGASGTTTPDLYASLGIPNIILSDGPAGLNLTSQVVELPDGSTKAARVPENLSAYRRYFFGFAGMALKSQMADPAEGVVHYQYATAWPCSQLLAQSFDPGLLEEIGDATGAEMEAFGVTVWLAPGMNIHRNPLCGRTFEYYSEDPLVSGKMAAAIVRGVQKHPGKGMSVKHFAANNCELERNMSSSNLTERTLREIYLRGFEIAVKESAPMTVMAAYNKINGIYCTNSYDLLVRVLRNEWGYEGTVISDWDSMKCVPGESTKALSGDVQKAAAAQCDLVMPGRPDQAEALAKGLEEGTVQLEDLRRSAARIVHMIRKNTVLESK